MIRYFLESDDDLARATPGSSGFDLRAAIGTPREMPPGQRWLVSTGLYLEMPISVEAQVRSRSGLAINSGVVVLNAPGTIDSDYRGEVKVSLINLGQQPFVIVPGERIAQLVFAQVITDLVFDGVRMMSLPARSWIVHRVGSRDLLSDTSRGSGGHGSTGR